MVEIAIVNRGSEFARVVALLDQFGKDHHLAPEIIADMHVALDEVLTNITKYAYTDNAEHEIHIRFRVLDNVLEAMIEDDGKPFNPLTIPPPDISAPPRDRSVGGVGIYFVARLMDDVAYERQGDTNYLILSKKINN